MTEKFDAFQAALEALCIEHGVRMKDDWDSFEDDCGDHFVSLEEATEEVPAGLDLQIRCVRPLTAKEKAEAAERQAKWEIGAAEREESWRKVQAEWRARQEKDLAERMQSPEYQKQRAIIDKHAAEQRKKQMRVTRIPGDANDIGNKTCRVWCNEVEVTDWTVADDFRRIVEAPGRVLHGAVRIEMGKAFSIPADAVHLTIAEPAQPVGFHGIFVHVPDEPAVEAPAEPAPTFAAPAVKVAPKHIPARKRKGGK
jgi:hypothetical protein